VGAGTGIKIAFTLQGDVSIYRGQRKTFDDEIIALMKLIDDGGKASRTFGNESAELNKRVVSTAPTIKSINDLLRDSGSQGFTLREKRGQLNVYEVVRQDGTVADKLSEGERNFIAFLYFYHLVRGSHTDADVSKDKIVVIDDPVSSMDSSVLFIVSTLVREMVEVCHNNASYLLQASNLIPFLTIKEQMVLYNKITKSKVNQPWMNELFLNLDVEKLKNKYPNELSGGERQRSAIAKALYHQPSVIFADEPTANLDTNRAYEVVKLLAKETKEQKKATIMVTHDERMLEFCDKVYVIVDGVLSERTSA
jgi:predicted ABC-type transport system involved in lysophospholipase L1 biosynthesis ATPase subunit